MTVDRLDPRRATLLGLAFLATVLMAGCKLESALLEQPQTSGKSQASEDAINSPFVGSTCELKSPSGAGICEDGRQNLSSETEGDVTEAAPEPASYTSEPDEALLATETQDAQVPQDGTWYCDNLSGGGNYGTWEMTQHPEMFDVSSCYRVD